MLTVESTPIFLDTVSIKEELKGANELVANRNFTVELVGVDAQGNEVSRTAYTMELIANGDVFTNTLELNNQVHDLTYHIELVSTDAYSVEKFNVVYTMTKENHLFGTNWILNLELTPKYEDQVSMIVELVLDNDTDANRTFVLELITEDADKKEIKREQYEFTVEEPLVQGFALTEEKILSKTIQLDALPYGYNYRIVEKSSDNYDASHYVIDYTESKTAIEYGYAWTLVARNRYIKDSFVTVEYVDEQQKPIATKDVITGKLGTEYETKAKTINGYTYKEVSNTSTATPVGVISDAEQTVVYVYSKNESALPDTGLVDSTTALGAMMLLVGIVLFKRKETKQD